MSPGSQMTFRAPSMARSSASASALVQPGLRFGLRTQVSAVISVPSPSDRKPPPSTTSLDRYTGSPARSAMRSPRAASLSYGLYLLPHALKVKAAAARAPAGPTMNVGAESRSHESSMGIET